MSPRPDDLDRLLRDTVAARGRELVPDSATPPPLDLAGAGGSSGPTPSRTTTRTRPAWWLTTGLAAAAAALLVVGTTALHAAQTGAERPAGPLPATRSSTSATPVPTGSPGPTTTWTADPRPYTDPVGPSTPSAGTPPATTAPRTSTTAPVAPSTPSTTAPAVPVGVYADCNQAPSGDPWVQRPASLSLACADAGEILQDITWTSWGPTGAVGQATVVMKSCVPDCASGGTTRSATTVTLGQVGTDGTGRAVFSVARLSPDPIPTHLPEHPGYYVLPTRP